MLVLSCPVQGVSANDFTLRELMAALSEVNAVNAEFREVREFEILQEPLVLTGALHYRAPGYLKKQTLEPHRERVEIRGDRILLTGGNRERQTLSLDEHPALRAFVESFRATLSGDLEALERYYHVRLEGNRENWRLRLEPRAGAVARHVSSITLRGHGARVQSIVTLGVRGARTVMTITPTES